MLTFYPEFEAEIPREVEVLFLLDLSCSMKVSRIINCDNDDDDDEKTLTGAQLLIIAPREF